MAGLEGLEALDLPRAIADRAALSGVELAAPAARALARHARAVVEANPRLHLTTIEDPGSFLERHLGEAFEGAALLPHGVSGLLLDLGSGNGYPGLPLSAARPGLRAALIESSRRKVSFLRSVVAEAGFEGSVVLERRVERAADLEGLDPIRVLAVRAVGRWHRILPKLACRLAEDGRVLLWAGSKVEEVARRASWRGLMLVGRRALPGREGSWVWEFKGTVPPGG